MTLTLEQKYNFGKYVEVKMNKTDVRFYVVQGVDDRVVNVDHTVENEIQEVILIPLYKACRKEVLVPGKNDQG